MGITWLEATVTGRANHAGTTPIDQLQDAGLAAAKLIISMREIASDIGGEQRATCCMIAFEPNAIDVIPGKATFTVDLRNSDGEDLAEAEERLYARAKEIKCYLYIPNKWKIPQTHNVSLCSILYSGRFIL